MLSCLFRNQNVRFELIELSLLQHATMTTLLDLPVICSVYFWKVYVAYVCTFLLYVNEGGGTCLDNVFYY